MSAEEISSSNITNSFFFITLIYFIVSIMIGRQGKIEKEEEIYEKARINNRSSLIISIIYGLVVVLIQIIKNVKNVNIRCGSGNTDWGIIHTIVPNIFIFGLTIMLVMAFPAWKSPFSNTIGFLVSMSPLGGDIKRSFNGLILKSSNKNLVTEIMKDSSMMINEITPENFELFIKKMRNNGLISSAGKEDNDINEYLANLYNGVYVKDLVSKSLWYLLSGLISITIAYNSILSMECQKSLAKINENINKMEEVDDDAGEAMMDDDY
jgi:uncharacterized integral membrane protein